MNALIRHLAKHPAVRSALRKEMLRLGTGCVAGMVFVLAIRWFTGRPIIDGFYSVLVAVVAVSIAWVADVVVTYRAAVKEWKNETEKKRFTE